MYISDLYHEFASSSFAKEFSNLFVKSEIKTRGSIERCGGSSAAVALCMLSQYINGQLLVVIGDSADDMGYLYHDISRLIGEIHVGVLPSAYKRDIRYGQIDSASVILRTDVLSRIGMKDETLKIVLTSPEGISERVKNQEKIENSAKSIDKSQLLDLIELEKWLLQKGFFKTDYVYEPGQYAIRGSIIDIYSYNNELPFRIDLFGNEIESMRVFNVETQLSEGEVERIVISSNIGNSDSAGISLLEYLDKNTIIAVRDFTYTMTAISGVCNKTISRQSLLSGEGNSQSIDNLIDFAKFEKDIKEYHLVNFTSGDTTPPEFGKYKINMECKSQGLFHKNFDLLSSVLHDYISRKYRIYLLSDNENQIRRISEIFDERNDNINFIPVTGVLHEGFIDNRHHICVLTDHQIFERFHKYTLKNERARSGKLALSLKELSSIEPGDYIVHIDHGIGRFAGLLRTEVNGHIQEMIKLVYQNNDVIFVSIHSIHKLAKYKGKEGEMPKINKLGSGAWNKIKEKTKTRLKDIARDLIKLYAARREEKGFAFSPDSYMQNELEASFQYEDTPDQHQATLDVKSDMESSKPMDRLICGDVGFGKTEIAVRAAFKAAADNKQTAILVPTTVLAYQHYNTFKQRLKDFPVNIEFLSRSKTATQTKEIIKNLEDGKIDIIIGTHKLIGSSIKFKDLGLLIIDEEQKFGVGVKEKLKQLKVNVDTLTMSATPIPRTLQFSLMGARDLSAITTPPPNRYPIITTLGPMTDEMLKEAINFELSRNGQVFIINNKIEGLYDLQNKLSTLIPDIRSVVAHGKLEQDKLENAILAFNNHDYDVMLATTIIENGVDMPNVNTIIIHNAHTYGLSELHQLRGRVGRASRKAFCYLVIPDKMPLTDVARRRLQAIENFSDLGSGIHIAMQDLDIRGAGNLLGAEQSGFIADLGYETYQKVLKEAVIELKTQEFADTFLEEIKESNSGYVGDCVIESDMELMLPYDYVPNESERILLYQQLDNIENEKDLSTFKENLIDRFGKLPKVTAELIMIPRLRRLARQLGIEKVVLKQNKMYIYFVDESNAAYYQSEMFGKLLNYAMHNTRRVQIREMKGKRSFLISDVHTIEAAVEIFNTVLSLPSV